jgi:hypothetical protein
MRVPVTRVSQIGSGDASTRDVLSRFVAALGGTLKLIADEQLKLARHARLSAFPATNARIVGHQARRRGSVACERGPRVRSESSL